MQFMNSKALLCIAVKIEMKKATEISVAFCLSFRHTVCATLWRYAKGVMAQTAFA